MVTVENCVKIEKELKDYVHNLRWNVNNKNSRLYEHSPVTIDLHHRVNRILVAMLIIISKSGFPKPFQELFNSIQFRKNVKRI